MQGHDATCCLRQTEQVNLVYSCVGQYPLQLPLLFQLPGSTAGCCWKAQGVGVNLCAIAAYLCH